MKLKITQNFPTSKMFFFLFNILLMLIAAGYLGIGSWLVEAFKLEKTRINLIKEYYTTMGILMLVEGGLCGLLSFIGYILTFWRRLPLIVIYLVALTLIFFLGISIGVAGFVYAKNVESRINENVNESLFMIDDYDSVLLVDTIHKNFKCCGLNGANDWNNWINKQTIPKSCCSLNQDNCDSDNLYKAGCLDKVRASIFTDMVMSGAISVAIVLPTILGIVGAGALIIEIIERSDYRISKA